ncbi:MAG: hypothetical protein LWX56_08495 [Ignavibacteria bacterium]|nr:hypothetical protein [Ignavibacteria bacterium]
MSSKISPALVCGFAAGVFYSIPGFQSIACCFVVPFAAWISQYLEQRLNGPHHVRLPKGAIKGIITGLYAALFATLFEGLISFILHSNEFVRQLPEMEKILAQMQFPAVSVKEATGILRQCAADIQQYGFSGMYLVCIGLGNAFTCAIFGIVGGILGANYNNKKLLENKDIH